MQLQIFIPRFFFFCPFSKSPDFPFSFPSRPPKVTMGTLLFSFHPFSFLSFTSVLLLYVLDVFLKAGWSGPGLGNSWSLGEGEEWVWTYDTRFISHHKTET